MLPSPPPGVSLGPLGRLGGVLMLLFAVLPAGCDKASGGAATCTPGRSVDCTGPLGCSGYQVCTSDGAGYGECLCGDAGLRPFPRTGQFSGLLGAVCATDDDCRRGLTCVTADSKTFRGEGPVAGMCLTRCLVAHNTCSGVDATAKCIVVDDANTPDTSDDTAYCMPGCKLGTQPASADKCRGRSDLVCTEYPTGANAGYCRPACGRDLDCAPRVCDVGTGLCADSAPSGDPIGASCDQNNSACAGGCIAAGPAFSECSGVCSYDTQGCGQNGDLPLDYFCSITASTGTGPGDLGYCAKLCDCDGDCKRSDAVCEPHHDLIARAGRQGLCSSRLLPSGSPRTGSPCM